MLPAHERKKLIGKQTDNTLRGRDLAGFTPVILDDIYVTGTYTHMMLQVLARYKNIVTAYLIISGTSLTQNAHAEHLLNSSEIRNPNDLLPFIQSGNFVFTRRVLKMLLRTPSSELRQFISKIPDELLTQIARGIIDTDSELLQIFPEACKIILTATTKRTAYLSLR